MKSIRSLDEFFGSRRAKIRIWMGILPLLLGAVTHAANITFYVANSTSLNASDNNVRTTMTTTLGHTVTTRNCNLSATADTANQALIVVSSTCSSTDIAAKFANVLIPVLTWESAILDDMKMTGTTNGTNFGTTASLTTITMVSANASHALAGGVTGTPTIYTAANTVTWGQTGTGAVNIATTSDATRKAIFGYDVGAAMVGMNAPGRRVGFFLGDDASLTATGNTLLQAALMWALPPKINSNPSAQTVSAGQTATFTVAAQGHGTLSYQWRKNGSTISGATSASYTTPATTTADNGAAFSCIVTNASGSATSADAILTVNSGSTAPAITVQPGNVTVTEGQTAQFSVTATGTAPLTYQWRRDGSNIAGATSSSYSLAAPYTDNGAKFSVVVTNGQGSVTSSEATLTVNFNAKITQQPGAATVQPGQTAQFCVVFTANPAASISWRKNGVAISGANGSCYTTPVVTLADNGALYSVVLVNSMGSVSSNDAALTVDETVFYADTLKSQKVVVGPGPVAFSTILTPTTVQTGTVVARDIVTTRKWRIATQIPDYVFSEDYQLKSLEETEKFARKNKHLPHLPSAKEMEKGVNLTELNLQLLKTVEELSLHVIELKKQVNTQGKEVEHLKKQLRHSKTGAGNQ